MKPFIDYLILNTIQTRKSGKAQNYCKPDYWNDIIMGSDVPSPAYIEISYKT